MASVSTMDTFPGRVGLNDPDAFHALGAQAVRADAGGPVGTAIVDPDGLQVRQPAALGLIHCVADVVARHRTLATNVASLGPHRRIVSRERNPAQWLGARSTEPPSASSLRPGRFSCESTAASSTISTSSRSPTG